MEDRLTPLMEDWRFIVSLLSTALSCGEDEVRRKLIRELDVLGANVCEAAKEWGLEPHVWGEDMARFYENTDSFMFETLIWSKCRSKVKMRKWILDYLAMHGNSEAKILTHGDGLGIDSCYLAQEGYQVDYYEVSEKCRLFAHELAERADLAIQDVQSLEALPEGCYDYIIQLDVLEHVPDPPKVVSGLSRLLKEEGKLIVHAPFWQTDSCFPTHLMKNRKYCGEIECLFERFSLTPVSNTLLWMPIVFQKATNVTSLPWLPTGTRVSLMLNQLLMRLIGMDSRLIQFIARRVSVSERAYIRSHAESLLTAA